MWRVKGQMSNIIKSDLKLSGIKHSLWIGTIFKKRSVWPIDETLTGTITLIQSEPGSNVNQGVFNTP